MAHMNRSGLPWLFHGHTLGIDDDRGAGGSGRFFRRSGASAADLFDQRFERSIGGRKGTLTLQAGLQAVRQVQPLLPGSRGQSAERADDALTGTLGGVLRLDEEEVGVQNHKTHKGKTYTNFLLAERADDALTGTLGGVLRLDEEEVGVGFALMGLVVLRRYTGHYIYHLPP